MIRCHWLYARLAMSRSDKHVQCCLTPQSIGSPVHHLLRVPGVLAGILSEILAGLKKEGRS